MKGCQGMLKGTFMRAAKGTVPFRKRLESALSATDLQSWGMCKVCLWTLGVVVCSMPHCTVRGTHC